MLLNWRHETILTYGFSLYRMHHKHVRPQVSGKQPVQSLKRLLCTVLSLQFILPRRSSRMHG